MSDWPSISRPNLPTVTPFHEASLGKANRPYPGAPASATLGSQIVHFHPWLIQEPIVIVRAFTLNGTTATGNWDIGVYDHEFNKIVSTGAIAESGTSTLQDMDIADTLLMPGRYWMAIVSSATGTIFSLASALDEVAFGSLPLLEQTGQSTLPAQATPVKNTQTNPVMPVYGFSIDTTY